MTNDGEQTACCGLYCRDCIPANQSLFETAAALRQKLEDCQFEKYAAYKSASNRIFNAYRSFREVLDAIPTLRCPKPCSQGGGNPNCAIRACARRKGLVGCWQCESFETCELLKPMCICHGDTVKHNLRMIRQHGVENWSQTRGKHYVWTETNERCSALNGRPRQGLEHHRVSFESMPWQTPAPGVRFKAYEQNGQRLRLAEFTKEFAEPDWCTSGHMGYVLEGEMEVDFRGELVTFRAGDGLFIPPGSEHGHKARTVTDVVRIVLVESLGEAVNDHA